MSKGYPNWSQLAPSTVKRHIRELISFGCKPLCFGEDGHIGRDLPQWARDYGKAAWDRYADRSLRDVRGER